MVLLLFALQRRDRLMIAKLRVRVMSIEIPFSAPCERNKDDIFDVISPYLTQVGAVLEIGTGTAQHAVHFAYKLPSIDWQTSDQASYLGGIRAQLDNAKLSNIRYPLTLDVNQKRWVESGERFSAVYTANTFHIMDWQSVQAFFSRLPSVCLNGAYLIVYGPFKYQGEFTSESNRHFDETLRNSDWGSGIVDYEKIAELAQAVNFRLVKDVSMPANNQCLIFQCTH